MRANFRTRARALEQLGEQLIKSNDIALLELIKNSYDACATNCEVILESPADPENGILSIKDDGHGMDEAIIMDAWLEIGTDYKSSIADSYIECPHGENRLPLGEKGIGRFAVKRAYDKALSTDILLTSVRRAMSNLAKGEGAHLSANWKT